MKDRFAIFLDIDGTIFEDNEVSEKDIETIKEVRSKGHLVFINSGRTLSIIPEPVKKLEVDGWVLGMGTHIITGDKEIKKEALSKDLVQKIADYAIDNNIRIEFQTDTENISVNSRKITERSFLKGDRIIEKFPRDNIYKFVIIGTFSPEDVEFLSPYFDIFQYETYGEVAPKGYDKARGIAETEKIFNISHENTMAIGDSINDTDMIEYAKIGVVMGNGDERLKKIADFVTDSVKNSGVSMAIEKFILKR